MYDFISVLNGEYRPHSLFNRRYAQIVSFARMTKLGPFRCEAKRKSLDWRQSDTCSAPLSTPWISIIGANLESKSADAREGFRQKEEWGSSATGRLLERLRKFENLHIYGC